jgi:hypothetical protein
MTAVTTTRYIRKPLYVDAVRVTKQNFDAIAEWCQGEILEEDDRNQQEQKFIRVRVHNPKNTRQTQAFVGDWILYTERGYKVYTNKAFRGSFDLVEVEDPDLDLDEELSEEEEATFQNGTKLEEKTFSEPADEKVA